MTRRTLYLPALIVAGILLACAAALLLALSEEAEATFPGKNGKIAYENSGGGTDAGIYTINPGGRGKSKVAEGIQPAYSPNGKRIALSGSDGHDLEIYTKNASGGDKRKVTNNSTDDFYPAYSPNGKKIAYECFKALGTDDDEDFDHEICTIRVGGGDKTKVTDTAGYASDPSWGNRP